MTMICHPSSTIASRTEGRQNGGVFFRNSSHSMMNIRLSLLLAFAVSLPACKPSAPPSSATASGKPKIALVMKSLANEFFQTMADGAKKHQAAPERE